MSSTNRGSKRLDKDEYQTPVWAVKKIVGEINWDDVHSFLEPCFGTGNIYKNVPIQNVPTKKLSCDINTNMDYFNHHFMNTVDLIITNPPYFLALEFLEKSLSDAQTVIYLLRLNFLGSQKRHKFWTLNPPSHLFVLSKRPSFTDDNHTDSTEYAWFCWDRGSLIKKRPGVYVL